MIEIIIIAMMVGILAALAVPSFNSLYESIKVDQAIAELRTSISQSQRAAIRAGTSCESSVLVQIQSSSSFQSDVSTSCEASFDEDIPEGVSIHTNLMTTPMIDVLGSRPTLMASSGIFDVGWPPRYYAQSDNQGGDAQGNDKNKFSKKQREEKTKDKKTKKKSWEKWTLGNCEQWGGCSQEALKTIGITDFRYSRQGAIEFEIQNNPASSTGMIVATSSRTSNGKMKCLAISRRMGLTRVGFYRGQLTPAEITTGGQCTTVEWNKQ